MATQIKKKYIENDAIDGLKLLLQSDQTLRRLLEDGSTQDVIAYLEGLVSSEETRALSAESGLDTRITTLEGQVGDDLQAAISALQSEIAQEANDRESADDAIKAYKPEQVIYVSKDGDDANSGSEQLPFLTIGAALASITDASPTKRYAVRVSSGSYVEASLALKANVFIVGEGAKEAVRIDSTISMDSSFSGNGDNRSGFANVLILKAADFDWSAVTSAAGKLYFSQTVFGSTVNMYGHNNAIAQAQFADCQFFGKLTISGINVSVFHNNLCWGAVELNQHPNGGMATVFNAVGGTIGGELKLTTTVDDFNRRCSAFLKSCYTNQITIDGVKSYVDATNDSIPSAGATILNSGNLIQLNNSGLKTDLSNLSYPTAVNQPIMPANTNSTNMGDWGKQWNWNFAYVHASTGSDLYLISYGSSYGADSTGKSIGIIADGAGLQENVDGGNISLSTSSSVSGTGVRGKILLDGKEIDVTSKQIKNLADGTDETDAVNKGQLDAVDSKVETEKGRIDAILLASDADKDSFAEIVQLINSVDTENDQAFASYVSSNNARVDALEAVSFEKENFVLSATDISNGYIDLANEAISKSVRFYVGRLAGFEGEDYELSVVNDVTRITFIGSFASGGAEQMEQGDKVKVAYSF